MVGGGYKEESLLGMERAVGSPALAGLWEWNSGRWGPKVGGGESPMFPVGSADPRLHLVAWSLGLLVTPPQTKAGRRKYVKIAHWDILGPRLRV